MRTLALPARQNQLLMHSPGHRAFFHRAAGFASLWRCRCHQNVSITYAMIINVDMALTRHYEFVSVTLEEMGVWVSMSC